MKLTKVLNISMQDMLDLYFSMSAIKQQVFLHAITNDVRAVQKPKKLTRKQEKAAFAAVIQARLERKYREAADKMIPELEKLIK